MTSRRPHNFPAHASPWGLTFLRAMIGVIMVMHGWQKLVVNGLAATADGFASLGIPFATVAATAAISIEIVAGAALFLGLASRVSALLLGGTMVVALITVHLGNGFFASSGGYEYVLFLIVGCLTLALSGPGAAALDSTLRPQPAVRQTPLRTQMWAGSR